MVKRKLYSKLIDHLNKKEFSILVGARQTGKSTILKQIKDYLAEKNELVYSFSLEDFSILDELNKHPENIFKFIKKPESQKIIILIDEIQYLDNPSNFLKLLFDKYAPLIKIIATGSSAFYIDDKFKDSLAGRKALFELYTLDFEEYLMFQNANEKLIEELKLIRENGNYISLIRNELTSHFNNYLQFGGYPAVVISKNNEEKIQILKELYSSYLKKDTLEAGIQYQGKFQNLLIILSHQIGSLLNINELSNTVGLSTTAVNNYIKILEKTFHIQLIKPFFNNIRKELTKMPKIYFNDLGMRNAVMNSFNNIDLRQDRGLIVENYIYTRLRDLYGNDNIKFWRTADGDETDFIYNNEEKQFAIESKYNYKEFSMLKHKKFIEIYKNIPINCRAYIASENNNNILAL